MSTQPQTAFPLHRLDIETYDSIVASGALDGQAVELLDGLVADMSPRTPAHDLVIERLTRHFALAPARLRVQMAIEIAPDSEPEPDLALVSEPAGATRHPRTALLVVEVAVTSQMIDRNVKAAKYAAADIPTYWLIDIPAKAVEVRTKPGPNGYLSCEICHEGQIVPCPLDCVEDLDIASLLADVSA